MKILAHRGYWKTASEKNTETAFERSFSLGYGTETDVRDCRGELLIAHDMPTGGELSFEAMLTLATKAIKPITLALNIKADGLAQSIMQTLAKFPQIEAFVFDMSVPDMRSYLGTGIPVFTRMSEVEREPAWLEQCQGIWLDGFASEWYDNMTIKQILNSGKRVCVVSPELHKRPHLVLWGNLRELESYPGLLLCTDFPEDATKFFGAAASA